MELFGYRYLIGIVDLFCISRVHRTIEGSFGKLDPSNVALRRIPCASPADSLNLPRMEN